MKSYRLHVKEGVDTPDDWGRVLIQFAYGGLRIEETFPRDCFVIAGPLMIKHIQGALDEYLDIFESDEGEKDQLRRQQEKNKQEEDKAWW